MSCEATVCEGLWSERHSLRDWPVNVNLLNYEWCLSGRIVNSEEFLTITVEVQLNCRYSFSDKFKLKVEVLNDLRDIVAEKIFYVIKTAELQSFSFQISQNNSEFNDDRSIFSVVAKMGVVSVTKNPVNVYQLKNPNTPYDLVLKAGSQTYYLQKSYLAIWSRYFDNYFKMKPATSVLDLKDISHYSNYFDLIFSSIYPGRELDVNDLQFPLLIQLAVKLEVPAVLVKCEPYWEKQNKQAAKNLTTRNVTDPCVPLFASNDIFMEHLIIAERYNLQQLQLLCFHHYKNDLSEDEQDDLLNEQKRQLSKLSLDFIGKWFNYPKNGLVDNRWLTVNNMLQMRPKLNELKLTDNTRTNDVVIVVGEKEYYLNKSFLSIWSVYFKTMFTHGFKEQNEDRIVLEDINCKEFGELIELIYPSTEKRVNDENVMFLVKLADRFEIPTVIELCENYLTNYVCEDNLIYLLELSDQYNLANLQVSCLKHIHRKNEKDLKKFFDKHRDVIKEFSRITLSNLI